MSSSTSQMLADRLSPSFIARIDDPYKSRVQLPLTWEVPFAAFALPYHIRLVDVEDTHFLVKIDVCDPGKFFLGKGWGEVVEKKAIRPKDVILFEPETLERVRFRLFGRDGVEKGCQVRGEREDDVPVKANPLTERDRKGKGKMIEHNVVGPDLVMQPELVIIDSSDTDSGDDDVDAEAAGMQYGRKMDIIFDDETGKPSDFFVDVTSTHTDKLQLNLPQAFVRLLPKRKRTRLLIFQPSSGKEYTCEYIVCGSLGRIGMKEWRKVVVNEKIKPGDQLRFTLEKLGSKEIKFIMNLY